jgi:hypothetical protein
MIKLEAPATVPAFMPPVVANKSAAARFTALPLSGRVVHLELDETLGLDNDGEIPFSSHFSHSSPRTPYPELIIGMPLVVSKHGLQQLAQLTQPDARPRLPRLSLDATLRNWAEGQKWPLFGIQLMLRNGRPVGVGVDIATHSLMCSILREYMLEIQAQAPEVGNVTDATIMGDYTAHWGGLLWHANAGESVGHYLQVSLARWEKLCKARAKRKAADSLQKLGIMLAGRGLDNKILPLMVLWDVTYFFTQLWPRVQTVSGDSHIDWGDLDGTFRRMTAKPEVEAEAAAEGERAAPAEPPVAGTRVGNADALAIPTTPVTAWWDGDADTLFEEVLTGRLPLTFSLDGVPLVVDGLPSATEAGPRTGNRRSKSEPRPLADTLPNVARSQFAVLPEAVYLLLDARRSAAKRYLEHLLGEPLPYHRRDTVNLLPDQLWAVPAVVSGQYGHWRDRLGRVRVLNPNLLTGVVPREPLSFRVTRDGKVDTLTFADNTPAQLAVCPSGWLRDTTPWWLAGLFGTPLDPTLLDFCPTLPAAWWERLAEVLAKVPDTAGTTPLDLDALLRNRPTAEI